MEERQLARREVGAVTASLAKMGVDLDELSLRAGFDVRAPGSTPVDDDLYMRLWAAVTQVDRDPTYPLAVGDGVAFGTYEVVDYLASSSENVGVGLRQMARYFRLVTPVLQWNVDDEEEPPAVTLSASHLDPRAKTISHMYCLGVAFGRFRRLTEGDFRFAEVVLSMARPRDEARLRLFFDCPIRYTRDHTSVIRIPRHVWHMPMSRHEPALSRVLERHAQHLVSQLGDTDDPLQPVRDSIAGSLSEGPRLEDIAKRVAMSPRTLQRRLREAGTTFQGLVDEARQRVAQNYLNDQALTIGEVAYLLGYSEPSAFVRAFKRWTGQTPRQFRASAF